MKYIHEIEAEDYYEMGLEWLSRSNYEKAEECFRHVIEENRHFIYAYIKLSQVLVQEGNYFDAIKILGKASRIDPSFDKLYYFMSKFSFEDGHYANAVKYLDKALELNKSEYALSFKDLLAHKHSAK